MPFGQLGEGLGVPGPGPGDEISVDGKLLPAGQACVVGYRYRRPAGRKLGAVCPLF
jgi:hypothetical protein